MYSINLLDMYSINLLDLIYDKLVNNTDYPQFEPEMVEEMELVYDANTHKPDYISITMGGREYRLTITEHKGE